MVRAMKDSKIEWIGNIPEIWKIHAMKNYISFINGYPFDSNDFVSEGKYPVIKIGDFKSSGIDFKNASYCNIDKDILGNYCIKKDDILIAMSGGTVGKIFYVEEIAQVAYINQRVGIIRAKNSRFIYYILSNGEFLKYINLLAGGTAQPNISTSNINKYKVAIPEKSEQGKIVDALDQRVFQINSILEETKISIKELDKYKQSLITETVTVGLNPDVEMKNSGIEWVKEVPKHWKVINSKRLFSERKEKATSGERQLTASQKYGIIYQDEFMRIQTHKVVTVNKGFSILKQVEPNDFVISMRSFQGGLEYSSYRGSISSAYVMLIPNELVYSRYYKWLLKSSKYINALRSTSNLVRDGQAMRYSNFSKIHLFKIPLEEQKLIADYLDEKCFHIESIIEQKQQLIKEFKDYKNSLIYEYVTGKKEVL